MHGAFRKNNQALKITVLFCTTDMPPSYKF
jgi:hypothetical protein